MAPPYALAIQNNTLMEIEKLLQIGNIHHLFGRRSPHNGHRALFCEIVAAAHVTLDRAKNAHRLCLPAGTNGFGFDEDGRLTVTFGRLTVSFGGGLFIITFGGVSFGFRTQLPAALRSSPAVGQGGCFCVVVVPAGTQAPAALRSWPGTGHGCCCCVGCIVTHVLPGPGLEPSGQAVTQLPL
jgi:hypothetical protein